MVITSIEEFLADINKLDPNCEYLYRGHADASWLLRSGAARRVHGAKIPDKEIKYPELVMYYSEHLLTMSKNRRHHHRKDTTVNDLELLAELQHYEAATLLLDFTRNPLAALWFACCSEEEKSGKVFIIHIKNHFKYLYYQDVEMFSIDRLFKEQEIYIWEPSHINERIPVQSSVFLFGEEPFKWKEEPATIEIDKDSKKDILEKLDKLYGLNENYFFPDFYGFAKSNRASSPSNHLKKFNEAYNQTDKERQIQLYTQVIAENRFFYVAYHNRGVTYNNLGKADEAIKDYNEAIRLNPDFTEAYHHRGNAYKSQNKTDEAIKDYNEAVKLTPDYAKAYNSRGLAHNDQGKNKEAIRDYSEAIRIEPNIPEPCFNRGLTYMEMGDKEKARLDFEKAKELATEQKNNDLLKDIEAKLKELDDLEAGKKKSSGSGVQGET